MQRMLLASDEETALQRHLDELTRRGQSLLLLLLLSGVGWAFFIDEILQIWLSSIVIPGGGDLLLIHPQDWIVTRWTLVALLALITIIPCIGWHAHRFISPGLFPAERVWLRRYLFFGSAAVLAGQFLLWRYLLPRLIEWAAISGQIEGVIPRYDAVAIFQISIGLSWWLVVLLLSSSALIVAQMLDRLGDDPFSSMRVRIHLCALFVIWITTAEVLSSAWLPMMLLLVLCSETLLRLAPTPRLGHSNPPLPIFSSDGALHRVGFVACGCAGACPRPQKSSLARNVGWSTAEGLCLSGPERDVLMERVLRQRITDLVISGCDGAPLPSRFKQNLQSVDCKLSGLDLLHKPGVVPRAKRSSIELERKLSLSRAATPWSDDLVQRAQSNIINEFDLDAISLIRFSEGGQTSRWSAPLKEGELRLTGRGQISPEFVTACEKKGILVICEE